MFTHKKQLIHQKGFALPTILIASIVMLMILSTAYSVTVAVRSSLQNQYYSDIAEDAAQSGAQFADACLRMNKNSVTWSDATPLRPNTDCEGVIQEELSPYVQQEDDYRTYFVVGALEISNNTRIPTSVASQGYIELTRASNSAAWRIFRTDTVAALSTPSDGNPVGTSIEGYWAAAPSGYLLENGQAVSRVTYANLFAIIGTTYGAGDGSTTFNVPDSQGKVIVAKNSSDTEFNTVGKTGGEKAHTLTIAEMPSHTHSFSGTTSSDSHSHTPSTSSEYFLTVTGGDNIAVNGTQRAFPATGSSAYFVYAPDATTINERQSTSSDTHSHTFSGTTGSNGSGSAHNVIQPYITLNRAIKY